MSWLDILGFSGLTGDQAGRSSPTPQAPAEWTTTDGETANGTRITRQTPRPLSPRSSGPFMDENSASTSYSPGIDYYQRTHVNSPEKTYLSSPDRAYVSELERETYISSLDRTQVRRSAGPPPMEPKVYSYPLSSASNETEVRQARPDEMRFVGQRTHVNSPEKTYLSSPDRAYVSELERETYISSPDRTYVRRSAGPPPMEPKVYSYPLSSASNETEVRQARPDEMRFVGEQTLRMADQQGWASHIVDEVPVPTSRVDYRSVEMERRVITVTVLSAL